MPSISVSPFAPHDEVACARRRALQQRMRVLAGGSVLLFGCLGALSFQAYLAQGLLTAFGLFAMGGVFLFEAVRQADRRFVAPLQALCQDDYSRHVELVLGMSAQPHRTIAAVNRAALAQRVDA